MAIRFDVSRLARLSEAATGTPALQEIYEEWSRRAVTPDLPALWASLGVKSDKAGRVTFDDLAPLSRLRGDLTRSLPASEGPAATKP